MACLQRHRAGRPGELEALLALRELGRRAVVVFGDRRRAQRRRPLCCSAQRGDRLGAQHGCVVVVAGRPVGVQVMGGDHLGDLLPVVRECPAQVLGGRLVARLALAPGQRLVGDRAQQLLAETVLAALRREGVGADREHLLAHQRLKRPVHLRRRQIAEQGSRGTWKAAAEHAHRPHQPPLGRCQRVEPCRDQGAERRWDVEVPELADHHETAVVLLQRSAADEHPERLHRVERHTLGALDQLRPHTRLQSIDERIQQLFHRGVRERVDLHECRARSCRRPALGPSGDLAAREGEDEDRAGPRPIEKVLDERQQALVGPLHVLEDEYHGCLRGEPLEEHPPPCEQLRSGHLPLLRAQQGAETRREELAVGGLLHPPLEALRQALGDRLARRVLGCSQPLAHHVGERPVCDPFAVGEAAAAVPQDRFGEPVDVLVELPEQVRLADARLARDRHQPRRGVFDPAVEELLEQPQIAVTAAQRGLEAALPLGASYAGDDAHRPPQVKRLGLPFDRMLACVLVGDRQRRCLAGDAVHEHGTRVGGRLRPGRGVDAVAHHKSFPGSFHRRRLAGDDPPARAQVRDADLLSERADRLDQLQSRPDRPLGVVLARHGRSPDSHHRIPDELLQCAAVAVNDRAAGIEVAAEKFPHILRVARLRECRVADDVDEQHRDEAQLRKIGFGWRGRRRCGQACPAVAAELLAGWIWRRASWTAQLLFRSALGTESRLRRDVGATTPTTHLSPLATRDQTAYPAGGTCSTTPAGRHFTRGPRAGRLLSAWRPQMSRSGRASRRGKPRGRCSGEWSRRLP